MQKFVIHWFKRDLRWHDNHALKLASECGLPVLPVFVFDSKSILFESSTRASLIYDRLAELNEKCKTQNTNIVLLKGSILESLEEFIAQFPNQIDAIYTNEEYEPQAIQVENNLREILKNKGIKFITCQDHTILHPKNIVKKDETPYLVFTPFARALINKISIAYTTNFEVKHLIFQTHNAPFISALDIVNTYQPSQAINQNFNENTVLNYKQTRDFPWVENGTSRLSVAIRYGMVSIREIFNQAWIKNSKTYINELIWREFYHMILYHFPFVEHRCFQPKFDRVEWGNNEVWLDKWKSGNTGFKIVDAGMRQLKQKGWMHNRVRMICASFLSKNLDIDWRWGEAYFAEQLLDYDLASNNGGWQWCAGCGVNAAPYFRVFNPEIQQTKFDKHYKYTDLWLGKYSEMYTVPKIVDYKVSKEKYLTKMKYFINS